MVLDRWLNYAITPLGSLEVGSWKTIGNLIIKRVLKKRLGSVAGSRYPPLKRGTLTLDTSLLWSIWDKILIMLFNDTRIKAKV